MGKNKNPIEKILDVDASMQGTITFRDPVNLRINGKFEGTLETRGILSVGENALVRADITGDRITVAGTVYGNIVASEQLALVAPAFVQGNIKTPQLLVSEGAIVNGTIAMGAADDEELSEILTLDEVARFLEVEEAIVEEWIQKKKIPAFQDDNRWKFRRSEIEHWSQQEKINV